MTGDEPSESPIRIALHEPGEDIELKVIAYIGSVINYLPAVGRSRVANYIKERWGQ